MRICENGIYRDAAPEEIAARETAAEQTAPTQEERIAALESAVLVMMGGNADV